MVYVPGGVFSTADRVDPPPPPPPLLLPLPPQLTRTNAARTIGSQTILIHRGLRNGRTSTKQDASAVPAPSKARICKGARESFAVALVKVVVIVSVAVRAKPTRTFIDEEGAGYLSFSFSALQARAKGLPEPQSSAA
jgi:hypothetical protein